MPCWAPPYGELVAVNVNTGKIAWKSTLGIQESLAADLGDKGVKVGTRNLGGSIATASGLVFIGATNDRRFRAFDAKTRRRVVVGDAAGERALDADDVHGQGRRPIRRDRGVGRHVDRRRVADFRRTRGVQARCAE